MVKKAENLRRRFLSKSLKRRMLRFTLRPRVGHVDFGDLGRLEPISNIWGWDRGKPIDRYYIENFLAINAGDIQGVVLEMGDNDYTLKFGENRIERSEIVHGAEGNEKATYVADLTDAPQIPSNRFDCIICTQVLQFIPDTGRVITTLCRLLKPGGVLLVTVPGISQLFDPDVEQWGDYWRFTDTSMSWIFRQVFPDNNFAVETYGNVLTASAFLYGIAQEELTKEELDHQDSHFPLIVSVRAVKPEKEE